MKNLHPKNPHNKSYDFNELIKANNSLKKFVFKNKYDNLTIDFANPDGVFELNKAILASFYNIKNYSIPKGYLCPPIPGRADYIHYIADLLSESIDIPKEKIKGVDIGAGANCIYSILGTTSYSWKFIASDIDEISIENIKNIINNNPNLKDKIEPKLQPNKHEIFSNILEKDQYYHFTMCNPPFHGSQEEALKGTKRKIKNLTGKETKDPTLNFAGVSNELWCKGGEIAFIKKMIKQSADYKENVLWFTTLVSKGENLKTIQKLLKNQKVTKNKIIEMTQGNKITRVVVWSFQ